MNLGSLFFAPWRNKLINLRIKLITFAKTKGFKCKIVISKLKYDRNRL